MRVFGRALPLALLTLLTPACVSHEYMGLSLKAGQLDPEIQMLMRRAQAGDKQAQLDLGIRFEEGRGVPQDAAAAYTLYQKAASESRGKLWVYVPSVGKIGQGQVQNVGSNQYQAGLFEAKIRMENLND